MIDNQTIKLKWQQEDRNLTGVKPNKPEGKIQRSRLSFLLLEDGQLIVPMLA